MLQLSFKPLNIPILARKPKRAQRLCSFVVRTRSHFRFLHTPSSITDLLRHVVKALRTLRSTLSLIARCRAIKAPMLSRMSSSCSRRSTRRINSLGASATRWRNCRIDRTESTSWIASETTAMPLAAELSPSIAAHEGFMRVFRWLNRWKVKLKVLVRLLLKQAICCRKESKGRERRISLET